jgi:hypothetical protein
MIKKEKNVFNLTTKVSTRKANFVIWTLTHDPIKSLDHNSLEPHHTRVGQKQPLGQRRQEACHEPQRAIRQMLQEVLEVH